MFALILLEGLGPFRRGGLPEIFTSLNEVVLALPVLFLMIGVLYCYLGRELFDALNFFIGGFFGLGLALSFFSGSGFMNLLLVVISFFIGGAIGFLAPYLLVGIIGFSLGVGLFAGVSLIFSLIFGIITAVVAVVLFRFLLPALTALIEGVLAGSAVFELTGSEEMSMVIGITLFVTGAIFQYTESIRM